VVNGRSKPQVTGPPRRPREHGHEDDTSGCLGPLRPLVPRRRFPLAILGICVTAVPATDHGSVSRMPARGLRVTRP